MEGEIGNHGNTLNTSIDINSGLTFDDLLFNCSFDAAQNVNVDDGDDTSLIKEKKEITVSMPVATDVTHEDQMKLQIIDTNESTTTLQPVEWNNDTIKNELSKENMQFKSLSSPSKANILKASNINVKIMKEADNDINNNDASFRVFNKPKTAHIFPAVKRENKQKSDESGNNQKSVISSKQVFTNQGTAEGFSLANIQLEQTSNTEENAADFTINVDRHNVYFNLSNTDGKLPKIDKNNIQKYLEEIKRHQIPKSICVTSSTAAVRDNVGHTHRDDIPLKITKVVPVFVCQTKTKGSSTSKEASIQLKLESNDQNISDPLNQSAPNSDAYNRCSKSNKSNQIIKVNVCNFLNNLPDIESREIWRRRINNIKERKRGKHMNDAFDVLRLHIPWLKRHKRMTSRYKILTGAITYITELKALLGVDPYEPVYVPGTPLQEKEPQHEVEIETNTMIKNLNKDANIKVDLIKTAFLESCLQSVIEDEENKGGVTAITASNGHTQQPF